MQNDLSRRGPTEIQLPDSVEQMLRVVAETAWRPSDLHQLSSIHGSFLGANDRPQRWKTANMEDVLRKFEQLGTEDQALVQEQPGEVAVA